MYMPKGGTGADAPNPIAIQEEEGQENKWGWGNLL